MLIGGMSGASSLVLRRLRRRRSNFYRPWALRSCAVPRPLHHVRTSPALHSLELGRESNPRTCCRADPDNFQNVAKRLAEERGTTFPTSHTHTLHTHTHTHTRCNETHLHSGGFFVNQFENLHNMEAHYNTTGPGLLLPRPSEIPPADSRPTRDTPGQKSGATPPAASMPSPSQRARAVPLPAPRAISR